MFTEEYFLTVKTRQFHKDIKHFTENLQSFYRKKRRKIKNNEYSKKSRAIKKIKRKKKELIKTENS